MMDTRELTEFPIDQTNTFSIQLNSTIIEQWEYLDGNGTKFPFYPVNLHLTISLITVFSLIIHSRHQQMGLLLVLD